MFLPFQFKPGGRGAGAKDFVISEGRVPELQAVCLPRAKTTLASGSGQCRGNPLGLHNHWAAVCPSHLLSQWMMSEGKPTGNPLISSGPGRKKSFMKSSSPPSFSCAVFLSCDSRLGSAARFTAPILRGGRGLPLLPLAVLLRLSLLCGFYPIQASKTVTLKVCSFPLTWPTS